MKVDLRCSVDHGVYVDNSLTVESMPGVSEYAYAPAWPRMFVDRKLDATADLPPDVVAAAASVIKVASWSNGFINERSWDTETVPAEVPPPIEWFANPDSISGQSSKPIYNCVSLPHFAIGLPTLHALESPIEWSYVPTTDASPGIKRILPADVDPQLAELADGHWMIEVGIAGQIMPDSTEALVVLNPNRRIVMHVNGGDGPLLLSPVRAVTDFWENQFRSDIVVYDATPAL